jgi:DNA-directed RNA polymerase subunit beta
MKDTSEYDKTDLNAVLRDEKNYAFESEEAFAQAGFTAKEFDSETGELVDAEPDFDDDDFAYQGADDMDEE